jgi:hypothetical protein
MIFPGHRFLEWNSALLLDPEFFPTAFIDAAFDQDRIESSIITCHGGTGLLQLDLAI